MPLLLRLRSRNRWFRRARSFGCCLSLAHAHALVYRGLLPLWLLAFFIHCVIPCVTPCRVLADPASLISPAEPRVLSEASLVLSEESPDRAYARLHAKEERRLWLSALEQALFLGAGAAWYYIDEGTNIVDWDNPRLRDRVTRDVLRLDNNTFDINHLWHPLSGAAFHAAPRANGAALWEAFAFTVLTSSAWEYLVEFREKISVNDLIVTPVAGIAIGEFATQLGRYLHQVPGGKTRRKKAAAWLFGPMESLHRVRRGPRKTGTTTDNLGYSSDTFHRFAFHAGLSLNFAGHGVPPTQAAEIRAEAELVAIPNHLRTGTSRRFFHDGDVTRLRLRTSEGIEMRDVDLAVQSVLFGYYEQRVRSPLEAHTWLMGLSAGYRYRRQNFATLRDDVGLTTLGISVRSFTRMQHAFIELGFDAGPGTSGIRSFRFEEWVQRHPDAVGKSILHKQGYSYGLGGFAEGFAAAKFSFVRLGMRVHMGHYRSIDGLDRSQETVTVDLKTLEQLLDLDTFLELNLGSRQRLAHHFVAGLHVQSQHRISTVDARGDAQLSTHAQLTRLFSTLGVVF